ncbi:hypothetical protein J5Y09_10460 [Roseomonas sp. PWR1]|uniref:Gp5/Type VI secretion system Vgr protein OB-fold domain-containing protein n=1 Tax=Roseomonas nitratireducens TaxID=2820810 RepID=A0ABS4AU81_9PROT|nr:phage baseplate assembly protein V [Neoroseomonas nitratireducens]MBP0464336.1 hypothetical protein [Neoroseomonas nitratireducens]
MANRYYGLYRGMCVDNLDPIAMGRVMVQVPSVLGDETFWAMPCRPLGAPAGAPPPVGGHVWIMFENGDPQMPVAMGTYPG